MDNQHSRKEKEINTHKLAIEGKRRNGGPRGFPPKHCRNKLAKSLERYKEKDLLFKEKQRSVWRKNRNGGQRGCPPSAEDRNFATKKEKINIMVQEDFIFFPITVVPP